MAWNDPSTWFSAATPPVVDSLPPTTPTPVGARRRKTRRGGKRSRRSRTGKRSSRS